MKSFATDKHGYESKTQGAELKEEVKKLRREGDRRSKNKKFGTVHSLLEFHAFN